MLTGDIGIIIPAYNEEIRLGKTLKTLKELPSAMDILVVDDGSMDKTGKIALEQGVNLLSLDKNYGKGYALKKGVTYLDNPIIVFLDADIGETAKEVTKLINPLLEGKADVTIGKIAFSPGKGGLGMVKGLSQVAFKFLTGTECTSVLSGQRAFKREVLNKKNPRL
jgi:glycosyltransferase involved in cell wall biosynthesis